MEQVAVMESCETKYKKRNTAVTLIVVLVILAIGGIAIFNKKYIYTDTINKNIFIQGVDVSGLTKEEALSILTEQYSPKNIELSYKDNKFSITPESIELEYKIEDAINSAYNYTKTDSYKDNLVRVLELNKGNEENFEINSKYNESNLSKAIGSISNDINKSVKDAKLYISSGGQINVTPAVVGAEVDIVKNKEAIYDMINNKEIKPLKLAVKTIDPNLTTELAKSVDTLLAQHTTTFNTGASVQGRVHNISRAAKSTSDIVLMPGEEFSYNTLTGPRSLSNGYRNAPIIMNGEYTDGVGGGVCQVSTTIYNAVLYSGLELTQIQNHSLPSSYASMGLDATVADGYIDFRFKNPYEHPIYIKNIVSGGKVTSRIYGSALDKQNIQMQTTKSENSKSYNVQTYRLFKDSSGNVIRKEHVDSSTYKKK